MTPPARIVALVTSAWLVAAACSPIAAPSPEPSAAPPVIVKTVKIVSSLPLQGAGRRVTVPIVNAIKMALEEQGGKAGSTTVLYESLDDASPARGGSWDPAVEAENARRAAADASVVAYIGPYNSGAARISIPITCQAGLAMVGPLLTYPGLTKPYDTDEPAKYYPNCKRNFVRVIQADDVQGAIGARWVKELGGRRVYVLHDADVGQYGRVLAESFRSEARRIGLEVIAFEGAPKANEFRALADRVAASGADFVYYGGHLGSNPGLLLRDLRQAKPSIGFMGPDGIIGNLFLRQAGESAINTYITNCCIEVADYFGTLKEWAERYTAKYGERPVSDAIYGYEAAKVVLAAIAKAGAKADDRATVRELITGTKDFDGFLRRWSFDEYGDPSLQTIAGLKVTRIGADFESSVEFQKVLK